MKKGLYRIVICLGSLIYFTSMVKSQTLPTGSVGVVYTYDAAGNRVDRKYVVNNSSSVLISSINKNSIPKSTENSMKVIKVNALFPNPTTGKVTLSLVSPVINSLIQLFDVSGRLLFEERQSGDLLKFDLSKYSSGIYLLHLAYKDSFINLKIIKR